MRNFIKEVFSLKNIKMSVLFMSLINNPDSEIYHELRKLENSSDHYISSPKKAA